MGIACIVLSSLALLAAASSLILFFVEKKRNAERRQAVLDYIDNAWDSTLEAAKTYAKEYMREFYDKEAELFKTENNEFFVAFSRGIKEKFEMQQREIEKLKSGVHPDYEAALAAAKAVNDFNAGISAIMNFDPIEAVRKRRHAGDEEVS